MSDADGTVGLFAMTRPFNGGGRSLDDFSTTFPEAAVLVNYSYHGGSFRAKVTGGKVKDLGGGSVVVPEGGYFLFSWQNPQPPELWDDGLQGEMQPIEFYEDGQPVGSIPHTRTDGVDGDPDFNPYVVSDIDNSDYSYTLHVPRLTHPTNLTIEVRGDGSTENVMLKVDGGMDVNSHDGLGPTSGELRDYPPALANDVYLGFEQMRYMGRITEKFAAEDVSRNVIMSIGAETYEVVIGSNGMALINGAGLNTNTDALSWIWHDPTNVNESAVLQFSPAPQSAAGSNLTLYVKSGYQFEANRVWLYYTTDGVSFPEGSGGTGKGPTQVLPFAFDSNGTPDGTGTPDWWVVTVPALSTGDVLRYKIGGHRDSVSSVFPFSESDLDIKRKMETRFALTNLNFETIVHHPHNNYGGTREGLAEGFHVARAKLFLNRSGRAPIYKTVVQTFYMDAESPAGEIVFPAANGQDLFGSTYGVVAQSDRSADRVLFRITDSDADNDDSATGVDNGNGAWVDAVLTATDPSGSDPLPLEWRFDYANIPPSGTGAIEVRLLERSSSTNMALSDVAGHFTTLTRTVDTLGPDYDLFFSFPTADGQTIGPGYGIKANFSKSLADGISEQDLINSFTLLVDSNLQARSDYAIAYNETADHHALAFTMPNFYNGDPAFLHHLDVELARSGFPTLTAQRLFRSVPVVEPQLNFILPEIFSGDGELLWITLPDVPNPAQSQRMARVSLESSADFSNVFMTLNSGVGSYSANPTNPVASTNPPLVQWDFDLLFPMTTDPAILNGTWQLQANGDTDGNTGTVEKIVIRDIQVRLREVVDINTNDVDDDDDGISDFDEMNNKGLPSGEPATWVNGDIHTWRIYGNTEPGLPDTDGDGLPDGLESGWRTAFAGTETNTDTNADGYPNFLPDLDPPFFNTCDNIGSVPNASPCDEGDKTLQLAGSLTDPTNPDTDSDGIPDGVEDGNRNGWVDGDGELLPTTFNPWLARDWPDGELEVSDTWLETDPTNPDTDGDGSLDGYDEDVNADSRVEGDSNTNRVYDAGESWSETDPLNGDTDGDGLPDGWERIFSFDPLDNGTNSLRTVAVADGTLEHGANGDPDADLIINILEYINGTNPRVADIGTPPPEGQITIGPRTNVIVVGAVENNQEFTDWTYEMLIALDDYDELEEDADGGDVYYRSWLSDGLETSRDLIAFYAHDGGAVTNGGDGTFYFRVDLHDLQALAESSGLDLYVVIDTGNTSAGERKLVESIEAQTDMRWEATVAVYEGGSGAVYVNIPGSSDTDSLNDTLILSASNVDRRDQTHPTGFKKVHYNSELDAVEFSISRQALLDAGWNEDFAALNYQIYSTRDGTDGGSGELDGPDIADSIRTDWIANDWADTENTDAERLEERLKVQTLVEWVGFNSDNDRGKRVKMVSLLHGNKPLMSASHMHDAVNTGFGSGYHRSVDIHEAYLAPASVHLTPTVASALEWAKVDTNASPAWRDGPAFNDRVQALVQTGLWNMVATTFADHLLPYFTDAYNQDNVNLATEVLENIYGPGAVSTSTFFTPERVLDSDVFGKIQSLGFQATFLDQNQHLHWWFGRQVALGDQAFRINRIENINGLPLANRAEGFKFSLLDQGPAMGMRKLLYARAHSGVWGGQHPQLMILPYNLDEFTDFNNSEAYEKLIRWYSSKGWIQLVHADQIVNHELDISTPPDGSPDVWNREERGSGLGLVKKGHDWIEFSAQGNYDNWYNGSVYNAGLLDEKFEIRPGTNVPMRYGMMYFDGVVSSAWEKVQSMASFSNHLGKLARSTLHASTRLSGFHNQNGGDLTKFSTGDFAYPDTSFDTLRDSSRIAQAQTRRAAIYKRIDDWAQSPPVSVTTSAEDVDLDGEDEYLLFNNRVFAVLESIGGRVVAVWIRDLYSSEVYQVSGNMVSYAGLETEEEGVGHINPDGSVDAHRTSLLKDQWADTSTYINDVYLPLNLGDGWQMTSSDGALQKTVQLAMNNWRLDVAYAMTGSLSGVAVYIRNGLSPNLYDLLVDGQETLAPIQEQNGVLTLMNANYDVTVIAQIGYGDGSHNANWNSAARDDSNGYTNYTFQLRNQAQTEQVELFGTDAFSFSIGFRAAPSDWDGDAIPNSVEDAEGMDSNDPADGLVDDDGDGYNATQEYIANTDKGDINDSPGLDGVHATLSGFELDVDARSNRNYYIYYADNDLMSPVWKLVSTNPIYGTGSAITWEDDGSLTVPPPHDPSVGKRFYKSEVSLPE